MNQVIHWSQKPKLGTRQLKSDGAGTSDIFKECIPVSLTGRARTELRMSLLCLIIADQNLKKLLHYFVLCNFNNAKF